MKKSLVILGIILMLLGVLGLSYDQITLKDSGRTEIGPLTLKYPKYKTYQVPRWLAGGFIVAGGILVILNLRKG